MNRKVLIMALLLALPLFTARAQEFDPEHRWGIEAKVGLSPLQTLMEKYKDREDLPEGSTYRNQTGPAATLSAVFEMNERISLEAGVNLSRAIYEISKPEDPYPFTDYGTITFTAVFSVRYAWLYRPHYKLYSGLGVGMTPKVMLATFFPSPIPNITPLGVTFGFNRVYFNAELCAGGASVGGLAGIGIKF